MKTFMDFGVGVTSCDITITISTELQHIHNNHIAIKRGGAGRNFAHIVIWTFSLYFYVYRHARSIFSPAFTRSLKSILSPTPFFLADQNILSWKSSRNVSHLRITNLNILIVTRSICHYCNITVTFHLSELCAPFYRNFVALNLTVSTSKKKILILIKVFAPLPRVPHPADY